MSTLAGGLSELYSLISKNMDIETFSKGIEDVKKRYFNLLDDRAAGVVFLRERGIKVPPLRLIDSIGDSVCSVVGKFLWVSQPRLFTRHDGREGRVLTATIEDISTKAHLTVWNTRIIESFERGIVKEGDYAYIIRIQRERGTRPAMDGNMGESGTWERGKDGAVVGRGEGKTRLVLSSGARVNIITKEEYRSIIETLLSLVDRNYLSDRNIVDTLKSIHELDMDKVRVGSITADIGGEVQEIIPQRVIEKPNRTIKLAKIRIYDGTGTIWVVLWGKASEFVKTISLGDEISIVGGRVKLGLKEEREIHVSTPAQIKKATDNL